MLRTVFRTRIIPKPPWTFAPASGIESCHSEILHMFNVFDVAPYRPHQATSVVPRRNPLIGMVRIRHPEGSSFIRFPVDHIIRIKAGSLESPCHHPSDSAIWPLNGRARNRALLVRSIGHRYNFRVPKLDHKSPSSIISSSFPRRSTSDNQLRLLGGPAHPEKGK